MYVTCIFVVFVSFCLPYCHRLAKRYSKLLFGVCAVFDIDSSIYNLYVICTFANK